MSDSSKQKLPTLFWVISGFALAWNLFGVYQAYFASSATQEMLQSFLDSDAMTPEYANFILTYPTWAKAVFWLGTVSGALGALCLLLRKSIAVPLFALSLISVLLMYAYNFLLSGKADVLTGFDYIISATVSLIAAFMFWFSRKKKAKGWLN